MTRLIGAVLVLATVGTLAGGPSSGRLQTGQARATSHGALRASAAGCSVRPRRHRDDLCVARRVAMAAYDGYLGRRMMAGNTFQVAVHRGHAVNLI